MMRRCPSNKRAAGQAHLRLRSAADGVSGEVVCTRSFTLIEVLAALVLLATTAVALFAAQSRAMQQLQASNHQRQAAHLADELIATWRLANEDLTINAEGVVIDHPGWSWRRSVTRIALADSPGLLQIQLDIKFTDTLGRGHVAATYVWLEATHEPAG